MKIQYLGTAAAEGFPAVFCNCEACKAARADIQRELRTRSQMLIDNNLLIDFPPDSYLHAVRFGIDLSSVQTLLVTHSHSDHFYAQEFINRGYKFAVRMANLSLDIYGNADVLSLFEEETRHEMREDVRENIRLHSLRPFEHIFVSGGYEVFALPACHMPKEEALLYAVRKENKSLLYLNDTGEVKEDCLRFLKQNDFVADFISMDCTFADDCKPHSLRHMGFNENEKLRDLLVQYGIVSKNAKYYVTHFSHNSAPLRDRLDAEVKHRGFIAAYDGLEINI